MNRVAHRNGQHHRDEDDGPDGFFAYARTDGTTSDVVEECATIEKRVRDTRYDEEDARNVVCRHPGVPRDGQHGFHLVQVVGQAGIGSPRPETAAVSMTKPRRLNHFVPVFFIRFAPFRATLRERHAGEPGHVPLRPCLPRIRRRRVPARKRAPARAPGGKPSARQPSI